MRIKPVLVGVALATATPLFAADGVTTGEFFVYSGPFASIFEGTNPSDPGEFNFTGLINGGQPSAVIRASNPEGAPIRWVVGSLPLSGTSVTMVFDLPGASPNIISFTGASFSGVAAGDMFKLGTISFTNGGWFGDVTEPSFLGIRITTSSPTPGFSQTLMGSIAMIPLAATPQDCSTLAGQQAQADVLVAYFGEPIGTIPVAAAYETGCAPAGFTNTATFDLMGKFGSLFVTGFANPVGGFLAPAPDGIPAAPPPLGVVPEPATWAMLIAGFGLVGGTLRRRRVAAGVA